MELPSEKDILRLGGRPLPPHFYEDIPPFSAEELEEVTRNNPHKIPDTLCSQQIKHLRPEALDDAGILNYRRTIMMSLIGVVLGAGAVYCGLTPENIIERPSSSEQQEPGPRF